MQTSFLSRLYKHSRIGSVLCLFYLLVYAFFFSKKMDMVLFPYNNMFAPDKVKERRSESYHIKSGGELVKYSHFLWWKKDLMESSGRKYISGLNQEPYVSRYIEHAFNDTGFKTFLRSRLVPPPEKKNNWPAWYITYGGVDVKQPVTFWKYIIHYGDSIAVDSVRIR